MRQNCRSAANADTSLSCPHSNSNPRRKAPYLITVADQALFAFAALWDRSVKEDGTAVVELRSHHPARQRADD